MTKDDRELIERLRAKKPTTTSYAYGIEGGGFINPDGPAAATRLEALQAQPVGEESGWLIEMVEPDHNKSPVPRWWHPEHGWTWDANKALRFAREIDAQDYILGSGRLPGKPTEHMFLDSAGGEA